MKKENPTERNKDLATGIALGCSLGVLLGISLHNISLWLPIGTALGISLGSMFDYKGASKEK